MADVTGIIRLLGLSSKLKNTMRHDYTSTGRNESVADHSWRLALLVFIIAPYLESSIDTTKAIKMALIHDIVEAVTGDIPYFRATGCKHKNELKAMDALRQTLGDEAFKMIYHLWIEYEQQETNEAKIVKALDKIEAQIQQNEAGFATWLPVEKADALSGERLFLYSRFDKMLLALAEATVSESRELANCSALKS